MCPLVRELGEEVPHFATEAMARDWVERQSEAEAGGTLAGASHSAGSSDHPPAPSAVELKGYRTTPERLAEVVAAAEIVAGRLSTDDARLLRQVTRAMELGDSWQAQSMAMNVHAHGPEVRLFRQVADRHLSSRGDELFLLFDAEAARGAAVPPMIENIPPHSVSTREKSASAVLMGQPVVVSGGNGATAADARPLTYHETMVVAAAGADELAAGLTRTYGKHGISPESPHLDDWDVDDMPALAPRGFKFIGVGSESVVFQHEVNGLVYKVRHDSYGDVAIMGHEHQVKYGQLNDDALADADLTYAPTLFFTRSIGGVETVATVQPFFDPERFVEGFLRYQERVDAGDLGLSDLGGSNVRMDLATGKKWLIDCLLG